MLNVISLSAGYGALTVLHNISMQMAEGEAVAIVGANGAGKTTLVRALCGLNRAKSGCIMKSGVDLTSLPAHHRPMHGIATLLENRRLFGAFTIRENLRLAQEEGAASRHSHHRFSWDDVCTLFPIIKQRESVRVELLSGGQQQQVAIARCLLLQPDLLILDEPSTGLAPIIMSGILDVLRELRKSGMSILLVEQSVGIAEAITDRAYVMALGKIVCEVKGDEWRGFVHDERLTKAYLGSGTSSRNDLLA